jgi:hypothetical protein
MIWQIPFSSYYYLDTTLFVTGRPFALAKEICYQVLYLSPLRKLFSSNNDFGYLRSDIVKTFSVHN